MDSLKHQEFMGNFSNGTESKIYFEQYCERCIHVGDEDGIVGCAVWDAHMDSSPREMNKRNSLLHLLIPVDEHRNNQQCRMFVPRPEPPQEPPPPLTPLLVKQLMVLNGTSILNKKLLLGTNRKQNLWLHECFRQAQSNFHRQS
jgi:hypothetical protein